MELWCVVEEIFKRHNMYGLKFSSGTRLIEDQYQSQKTKYTLFQFMEIKRLISFYTYKKMLLIGDVMDYIYWANDMRGI